MEETRSNAQRSSGRLKHLLISCTASLTLVGYLVGAAYLNYNAGGLGSAGEPLVWIGLVVLIPPGIVYLFFSEIKLLPELRGRESFIVSNPWLWIFCVVFYTVAFYMILRWRHSKK